MPKRMPEMVQEARDLLENSDLDEIIFTGTGKGPKPKKGKSVEEILASAIALRDELLDLSHRLGKEGKPAARKKVESAKERCHQIMTLLRAAGEEAAKP